MKTMLAFLLISLPGCYNYNEESHADQCMRRQIMMECIAAVKNGANATHKDLGPLVDECQSAAYYQSMRKGKFIKEECRA